VCQNPSPVSQHALPLSTEGDFDQDNNSPSTFVQSMWLAEDTIFLPHRPPAAFVSCCHLVNASHVRVAHLDSTTFFYLVGA